MYADVKCFKRAVQGVENAMQLFEYLEQVYFQVLRSIFVKVLGACCCVTIESKCFLVFFWFFFGLVIN
jgi:hypothetical protein